VKHAIHALLACAAVLAPGVVLAAQPDPASLDPAVNTSAPARPAAPTGAQPAPQPATSQPPAQAPATSTAPSAPRAAPAATAPQRPPQAATPAPGAAARPNAAPATGGRARDRLDLEATQITGNRELPRVMYVVPWKKSDLGDLGGRPANSLLDEVLAPVDRDVFLRQNRYYDALKPDAKEASGPAPAN